MDFNNIFYNFDFLKIIGLFYLLKNGIEYFLLDEKILNIIKKIPYIKKQINLKKKNFRKELKNDLRKQIEILNTNPIIPYIGYKNSEIIHKVKEHTKIVPFDYRSGRVSGCVYAISDKVNYLFQEIYPILERSNPLHPDIYPGLRKMEAEIVNMCGNILKSPNPSVGCFTSGGTESILLAMRTYKKIAQEKNKKVQIILAKSAHAAFWKASEYFDMDLIEIETDEYELDSLILEKNIKNNEKITVVVASAPTFNFGIIDDIYSLSDFCSKNRIYLHVDMCLGGFIVPFLGLENINFELEGITSISMDTHKYGYGPKGGSVLLYKNKSFLKKHCFVKVDWTGGIYGTSNLMGSRSGALIGLTWATLLSYGLDGYSKEAKKIQKLTLRLKKGIDNIDNIRVLGNPYVCIVALSSDDFNIYLLCDKLKQKGWSLNILQNPESFHFCITSIHNEEIIDELILDISNLTKKIMKDPERKNQISTSIYGSTQKINDKDIIDDVVREYICCLSEL